MSKCSKCGKPIEEKDSVYKDKETNEVFCGVCYIKHLEKDIVSSEEEALDIEPVKTRSRKFLIFLIFGIILIMAEVLIMSDTSGGKGPVKIPKKKRGY